MTKQTGKVQFFVLLSLFCRQTRKNYIGVPDSRQIKKTVGLNRDKSRGPLRQCLRGFYMFKALHLPASDV